jgi:hypothetical protein
MDLAAKLNAIPDEKYHIPMDQFVTHFPIPKDPSGMEHTSTTSTPTTPATPPTTGSSPEASENKNTGSDPAPTGPKPDFSGKSCHDLLLKFGQDFNTTGQSRDKENKTENWQDYQKKRSDLFALMDYTKEKCPQQFTFDIPTQQSAFPEPVSKEEHERRENLESQLEKVVGDCHPKVLLNGTEKWEEYANCRDELEKVID